MKSLSVNSQKDWCNWNRRRSEGEFLLNGSMKAMLKNRSTTIPDSDSQRVCLCSPPQRWSATTVLLCLGVHLTNLEERLSRSRLIGGTSCPSSLVSSGSTPRWWRGFQVLFLDTHTHTRLIAVCTAPVVDVPAVLWCVRWIAVMFPGGFALIQMTWMGDWLNLHCTEELSWICGIARKTDG